MLADILNDSDMDCNFVCESPAHREGRRRFQGHVPQVQAVLMRRSTPILAIAIAAAIIVAAIIIGWVLPDSGGSGGDSGSIAVWFDWLFRD
jgi:hypothetical protein